MSLHGLPNVRRHGIALFRLTNQDESQVRELLQQMGERLVQIDDPFVASQSANETEHRRINGDSQRCPQLFDLSELLGRVLKSLGTNSVRRAVSQHNRLLRRDQFSSEEFLSQAFADADHLMSTARRDPFGRREQSFFEACCCFQPQPAQRVNPHRHARQLGREHAEQSRFRSPRVDDVRSQSPQDAAQFHERPRVGDRRDLTLDRDRNRGDLLPVAHDVE